MQIKSGRNLDLLASRLESIKAPGGGFEAFEYERVSVLLDSAVAFAEGIPQSVGRALVANAIRAAGTKTITAAALREALGRAESQYLAKPRASRVILSTVSLAHGRLMRVVTLSDAVLRFFPKKPRRYDRAPFAARFRELGVREPSEYSWVAIKVTARSPEEAYNRGVEALDFARGVWNYLLNRGHHLRLSFGAKRPVNRVVAGPVQTVHDSLGRLDGDLFYYEPLYHPANAFDLAQILPRLQKADVRLRRQLARHPYGDQLKPVFVRYARALDGIDFDGSFLKLWGLLEYLTHTVGRRYDDTVSRALWLFEDRPFHREILEHLREYRNERVHFDRGRDTIEVFVYQLKGYVEALIFYHVRHGARFGSCTDAAEALALPAEESDLKANITRYRRVLSIHRALTK